MSYLVLARKWRPRSFDTLVGQEHVVRALTHALTTQRLHHAWLFTGTRGVGKTTLSRILAKSLNCETGITATPCGKCRACTEIDSGRFVDYLELDAASNRGVDEMTQLLEQAVYSPTVGRFKVYMIDEVHMLTGHAFNAMLKTLEEPPAHVKFILATTDPQKIPVTVLSRCLQFNLKQMPPESIVGHLSHVLDAEQMPYETPALRLIGQAARGSMRDALSLTDQAIAFSAGNLTDDAVRSMLGTIDQRHLVRLLDALADGDGAAVLAVADELSIRSLSYSGALGDLAVMLSQIAIAQRVATAAVAEHPLGEDLIRLASRLNPDAVQLFYSIAVHSRAELALAPDEYAGFAMACVRMLAFSAESGGATVPPGTSAIVPAAAKSAAPVAAAQAAVSAPAPTPASTAIAVAGQTAAVSPAQNQGAANGEPPAVAQGAATAAESRASATASQSDSSAAVNPASVASATVNPGAVSSVAGNSTAVDPAPASPAAIASSSVITDAVSSTATSSGAVTDSASALNAVADLNAAAESSTLPDPSAAINKPVASQADVAVPSAAADMATLETVPTAAATAVLPEVPGTPPSAESGAVSPPVQSDSASTATDDSPPWDVTQDAVATPAVPAASATVSAAPATAPAASQNTSTDAPVNSPRAAMARALAAGPASSRDASAAQSAPANTPAPTRGSAAPARAPAPAPPPARQSRASSGPPDLEPPPWLMDDAEPSFAEPPPGTQGRRDGAGSASRGYDADTSPRQSPQPSARASAPASATARQAARQPAQQPAAAAYGDPRDAQDNGFDDEFESPAPSRAPAPAAAPAFTGNPGDALVLNEPWSALAARLPVRGIAAQLARQSELLRIDGNLLVLRVSARTLAEGQGAERLRSVLETHFGRPVRISVEVGTTGSETAHAVEQSVRSARQQAAEEAILADPFVRTLMDNFGGQIVPNSISPVSPELPVKETPK
ncbi:DNA polymerase III subunit gamma/tau [Pigmentiphaga aceris]|uniref:DNA-directed DNA polymerase n=1 Tax=Pigmentiphaga aceris TaxID=1940612 RepID=A0A5C0ATR5_9BURK|nr:DNA polymerase III subunit gamma/tau [Pigmentiphaga aceris]QEI05505.1 DNA polymerase III subunit gamma/tau [Pigmentiphaga aceris]